MPSYFRVSPKLWNEEWNDSIRLLALYLLTSPHRTTEGLFRLPRHYVVADLGWSKRKIEAGMEKLVKAGFVRTHGDVVLVVKALKYQAPHNPNQMKAAISALHEVPATPLDTEFASLAKAFAEPFAKRLSEAFPERFAYALALTPTPAPTPSPSPAVGDDEGLKIFLKGEGIDDSEIDLALNRLRLRRAGYGKPITDEAAWLLKVARGLDTERHNAEANGQPPVAEIEGEKFRFVDGQWQVESPA